MTPEEHIELLTKKLKREKATRLQAESLLEEKSHELFNAKRLVEAQLSVVQEQAELDLTLLTFKSLLDTILLEYNQKLLAKPLSNLILQQLLDDLSGLPELKSCALNFFEFKLVSGKAITKVNADALTELEWKDELFQWDSSQTQLRVKILTNQEQVGVMSFNFHEQLIETWNNPIEQHSCLFCEMLSAAYAREQLLAKTTAEMKRAEHSERATRDFVAMINHELRTPLNGLIGSSELMEGTELSDYQKQLLVTINQSGEMLRAIINDLLDVSKMNAGMLQLNQAEFKAHEVLTMVKGIFSSQADGRKLQFSFTGIDTIPALLVGDADRIKQIFMNLIGNALKFTQEGEVKVVVAWEHDKLAFSVKDSGCGIPEDKLPGLFSAFTQVDNSSNRQFEGTGLGLSICKHLLDEMKGSIKVVSQVDQGSEFFVEIPLLQVEEAKPDEASDLSEAKELDFEIADLRVLVVEDIKVNQVIIKMMLKKLGITAEISENGQIAVDYLSENEVDVIFMDCRMPIMDGFEATRTLREKGYKKPIVALTASTTSMEIDECYTSGMDAVVNKPYQLNEIKTALEHWGSIALSLK